MKGILIKNGRISENELVSSHKAIFQKGKVKLPLVAKTST